ncbi:MAG: TonB-dependent receptor [Balneolaceae bacterium]
MKSIFTFLFVAVITSQGLAQTGNLTGTIVDKKTSDELIGVNVYIRSISKGTITDISGNYNIRIEPGTYTVQYSYVSYQRQTVTDVEIIENEVTEINISLESENEQLDEVMVSASRIDNNEVSLLRLRQKSLPVQDGISSQEINRIGFSNSAESMRQVTGASVEGGKFIVMRGLGDRYSVSSMDGVSLPTTDPYKNSTGLDLIPTSMVDNIVIKKTFSPELPGNFTGGAVDITTISMPDNLFLKLSTSVSYNDQTSFNNNFLGDPLSSKYSRLGYDDGSRKRQLLWSENKYLTRLNRYLIDIQNNNLSENQISDFNNTMRSFSGRSFTARNETPGLNHGLNVMVGNRVELGTHRLGYNIGINYSKEYLQYDERVINSYSARIPDGSGSRMQAFQLNTGTESSDEVTNGVIGTMTYQFNSNHELKVMSMYNHSATESVLDMPMGSYPGALSSCSYNNRVISYKQRQLVNSQLKGNHYFGDLSVKWSGNYILSNQYEPDTRFIGSPVDNSGQYFFVREVQLPFHFFRELNDSQYNFKVDAEYKLFNRFIVKTGSSYSRKKRVFNEFRFQAEDNGTNSEDEEFVSFREASGDYDTFFSAKNTGIVGTDSDGTPILGLTYRDQTRPQNSYTGSEQVGALYAVGVFDITEKFKIFAGARVEKTDFAVMDGSSNAQEGTIDVVDILPSVNIIYALNNRSNVRLSGTQTLARPNMRELAPFASFDLLGGFPVVGNPGLNRTNITNLDFRYELFPKSSELIAISAFYKSFENPIVLELDVASDQPQYEYINTRSGQLFGFEFELRKELGFIAPMLKNFKFATNFTYINSRVDLSEQEYETRQHLDSSIKPYRPFPFQSPYIANFNFIYENPNSGWDGSIYANISAPRLTANGSGAAPDIFEIYGSLNENRELTTTTPHPDLNLRFGKSFRNGFSTSLSISNIMDYNVVQYQEDNGEYFINSSYNPGRTFKLSFSYEFN